MTSGGDDRSGDDSLLKAIARAPDVMPPEGAALVGQRVGRFRVLRKLGSGGMGIVYEAEDDRLGRRVALKVLAHGDDEEGRARLVREARNASQVVDPHVAVIYEAGEDETIAFIAMELVDGEPLDAWLHTARPLPERLRVACEIASAVAKAHAKGIVHRDLKPGNVMIARDGSAKVLDFGLAKRPAGALLTEQGETATREGRLVGTPSYMSPEQVKGKPVDARSDVFSFGTLAYELFTGRRPFRGETITELLIAIDRDEPQPMRDASPHLPPSLVAVVDRCLRKRPEDRFASGAELLAALERARGAINLRRRPARARWAAAGLAVAAVAIPGTLLALRDGWGVKPAASRLTLASAAPEAPMPTPTAMTDLPPPRTANPEAAAAFAAAIQACHDGNCDDAPFRRAIKLDPSFAAAHLQLILIGCLKGEGSIDEERRHFVVASQNRTSLSERDRGVLDALEPIRVRSLPDYAETIRRGRALAARWPGDAELAALLGGWLGLGGHLSEALAELDRALSLDPKFAAALHLRAMLLNVSGRQDEALDAATRCLELSPLATNCAYLRGDIFARRGQCDLLEGESRRAVAANPQSPAAYHFLAQALAARDAPIESIRQTLRRQADLNDDEATRRAESYLSERRLALYAGDLATAIAREIDFEQAWEANDPSESRRNELMLFTLYDEIGESAKKVALAEKYLKHLPALTAQPTGNRAIVLDVLHRAGRMPEAEYVAKRSAWIDEARALLPPISQSAAWTFFYAYPARTESDAREALEALPRFEPLSSDGEWGSPACDEERIGNVYLRAGRLEEAAQHLGTAAGSCRILACMVPHLRAEEELGEALAARGDTAGACSALQRVLDAWGHAKPRSVTAERAREQARRLACSR